MSDRIFVTIVGASGLYQMDLGRHETLAVVLERARLALLGTGPDSSYVVVHDEAVLPSPHRTLAELADELGWGRQVELRMMSAEPRRPTD